MDNHMAITSMATLPSAIAVVHSISGVSPSGLTCLPATAPPCVLGAWSGPGGAGGFPNLHRPLRVVLHKPDNCFRVAGGPSEARPDTTYIPDAP